MIFRSKSPEQIRVPRYQQSTGPMGPGMITPMGPPSSVMTTPFGISPVVVQQPSIPYAVPITTGQPFVSYIDTTRPPPVMSAAAMVPMVMGPTCPSNQYYPSTGISQQIGSISAPVSSQVQFGHPPVTIYPPGTLGAAMRASFEAGQTQSQKKNRNRSKNNQAKKETNA
uniref:Protein muscleblind n=1 Tax=Heterorhabditis bacteriophora TaxID=37862 RepID=A0A1I7WBR1_HETBA